MEKLIYGKTYEYHHTFDGSDVKQVRIYNLAKESKQGKNVEAHFDIISASDSDAEKQADRLIGLKEGKWRDSGGGYRVRETRDYNYYIFTRND